MRRKQRRAGWRACVWLVAALATAATAGAAEQKFGAIGDFRLESGETIRDCKVGYRTAGTLNAAKDNAILFFTWFNGKSKDLEQSVGAERMLDPGTYYVVMVDALGDGVSSSPSNSATQPKEKFPRITMRDMVKAEHELATKVLGLEHVRAVMGISMGGMQTFQWLASYPEFMDIAIPIVGTPQQSSFDLLVWETQENTIVYRLKAGDESTATEPAMRIGQMLITTPKHTVEEVKREEFEAHLAEELANWKKENDPYDYLEQLRAMISLNIAAPGETLEDAAKRTKAKVLVIVARQDHLVNPIAAMRFAEARKAPLLVLEGDCGHLATACEERVMSLAVRGILTEK